MSVFHRRATAEGDVANLHIVLGLGNPGPQYDRTRHNAGFMVAEELAARYGATFKGSRLRADVTKTSIDGVPTLIAMPVTFMNESGFAARKLTQYYHVPLHRLIVVCDDIDIPFGTLRIRPSGSSGGNGGLKSIVRETGSQDFPRLRIGVGRPRGTAASHVLGTFSSEEMAQLPSLIARASDAVAIMLARGTQAAMNEFNRNWLAGT